MKVFGAVAMDGYLQSKIKGTVIIATTFPRSVDKLSFPPPEIIRHDAAAQQSDDSMP
jgi:hypothetical protein